MPIRMHLGQSYYKESLHYAGVFGREVPYVVKTTMADFIILD